jgi:hypothetical protein
MQIIFIWVILNYVFENEPIDEGIPPQEKILFGNGLSPIVRMVFMSIGILFITGWPANNYLQLLGLIILACLNLRLLSHIRSSTTLHKPEAEIGTNVLFIGLIGVYIEWAQLKFDHPFIHIPISATHFTAVFGLVSGFLFNFGGGTRIIRGFLVKAKFPQTKDENEARLGRIIGNLERTLLTIFVLVGSYEAMAFLVTGKGIIRLQPKKQEDAQDQRNKEGHEQAFSEYFLVGTFASSTFAIILGLLLKYLLNILWQ